MKLFPARLALRSPSRTLQPQSTARWLLPAVGAWVGLLGAWSAGIVPAPAPAAQAAAATTATQAAVATLPAVVVWDFDNQSASAGMPGDHADYLRRSLSENLSAALLQVSGLPVVERQRLSDLLAEQRLGSAALADPETRLRLGKIVGAQRMVFGGYFVIGDQVQVNVRVVETATSRVLFSDEATAPLADVMQQVQALDGRLVRALGGAAAEGRSYPAALWQAYDQALALADAGQLDAAAQALQTLLAANADFGPAARELVALLDRLARR